MSKLSELLSGSLKEVTAKDLKGVTRIRDNCFWYCPNLTSIEIPESVVAIGALAFCKSPLTSLAFPKSIKSIGRINGWYDTEYGGYISGSTTLTKIDTSKVQKDCFVYPDVFLGTGWQKSFAETDRILIGENNCILYKNPTGSVEIPSYVKSVVESAIHDLASTVTALVIPDTVEFLQGNVCSASTLTKCTVGSGVRRMNVDVMDNTKITTWIFRQPAGMTVELPPKSLGYNKSARTITIYTDNESIKAYNWSADNITANIYPLADAPA